MFYIFYPNTNIHKNKSQLKEGDIYIEYKDEGGYVGNEILSLSKKRKFFWIYAKVVDFLDKLANEDDLSAYFDTEKLKYLGDSIIEMRIPKTDKKGVFRIYYCDSELKSECGASILLDAEFKTGEPRKIESAKSKQKQYTETIKRRIKNGEN